MLDRLNKERRQLRQGGGGRKFSTKETLRAASVAADRSGNERAVRVAKMSAYIKRGTALHKNVDRLCDVWLAWSWQANFMFKPVH